MGRRLWQLLLIVVATAVLARAAEAVVPTPPLIPTSAGWLQTVNYYRAMANLPPVTEEPVWSDGGYKHGRYVAETGQVGHTEDPASPWYTPEGAAAGQAGNVTAGRCTERSAVESWMTAPFHAVGILDSRLTRSGFGLYPNRGCGATLDVIRGLNGTRSTQPLPWPADGMTVPLRAFGGEYPDPRSSCPGFDGGVGLPLVIQLPDAPTTVSSEFSSNGVAMQHCTFSGANYVNSDSVAQNLGRNVLASRNAVVLIPRFPLRPGSTNRARILSGTTDLSWTFFVAPEPPSPPTDVRSIVGTRDATISWNAPADDGGAPVTSYRVTINPGGQALEVAAGSTTARFENLTAGVNYTASVVALNSAGVSIAASRSFILESLRGLWLADGRGQVATVGGLAHHGDTRALRLNQPVVALAATPSGNGYWLTAGDGGVFSFGNAAFYGSTGSIRLNKPVVGMASTPSGRGYWFVASDGGVFSFGDAAFYGSTGSIRLNQPVVGMASTPSGRGYWLVASDGGVFAFGDAGFFGSTGSIRLNQPIVGLASTPSARGYWFAAADGGVFAFGDARFFGSAPGSPTAGIVTTATGSGYVLATRGGTLLSYGDAPRFGASGISPVAAVAAPRSG